jgi:hypothetical protein
MDGREGWVPIELLSAQGARSMAKELAVCLGDAVAVE